MTFDINVLVVSATPDQVQWLREIESALHSLKISCRFATSFDAEALDDIQVVLVDESLGAERVHTLLADVMLLRPEIPVVLIVHEHQLAANEYMVRYGAQDFVLKNHDSPATIRRSIINALDRSAVLRATEEAESQIRALIEALVDGILIVDTKGVVLFANPMTEQLLGKELDELYGLQTPFELQGKEHEYLFWERENSPPVTLSIQVSPIRWDGRAANLLLMRDVTTEQASYDLLKAARHSAEKAAAMKSTFLAHMSHELRLPLASIIGFAELIEEGETNPDFKEFAALIHESGQRLLDTINSVLDATRLDQHTLHPSFTVVSLSKSINSVVKRMQPLVQKPDVVLSALDGPDLYVRSDAAFLERILNNLIGNAAKFTNRGSITVSWKTEDSNAVVDITDTGIGIEPAFLKNAFDDFTQESSGPTRSFDGSGLGLSIVKKLLGMMDGTITVSSVKNQGSTFTFRLPLAPKPDNL